MGFRAGGDAAPASSLPRTTYYVLPGKRHEVISDASQVLSKLDFVFQRNDELVEVIRASELNVTMRKLIEREPDALLLRRLTTPRAVNLLTGNANWFRPNKKGELVQIDFPSAHATGLLADGEWAAIRTLTGLIGAPTLREDGSLLTARGYDHQSGLLFASATQFDHIRSEPSKNDAHRALQDLSGPFSDFPFVSSAARSTHIATLLTAMVRRSLPTAPATAYTAPVAGSGKTLLADSVACIAHGVRAAHMPFASGRDEFRKLLLAILLDGDPIALLDNVDRPLQSAELCNLLTTDRYADRILGESRRPKLDARVMVLVTANNLELVGDLTRRFLIAEIDPQNERPEARHGFRIPNLHSYLLQHRGRLAAAALTVLRAFQVANPPEQASPPGSFEVWSRWVREPLLWLGWEDPCQTTAQARADDPERERLEALLLAWYGKFASELKTAAEVIEVAKDQLGGSYLNTALRAALIDALGSEKQLESASLGYYLKNRRHRLVKDFRFERDGKGWRVTKLMKQTLVT